MKTYCYKDGRIVKMTEASLALNDIGVLRGYAVFDFLRTYNGRPFHLKEHLARFKRASKSFRFDIKISEAELLDIIQKLMVKNKCRDASVRLVATGGPSINGFVFNKPEFYILMEDLYMLPEAFFQKGAKLITLKHKRIFPNLKTSAYSTLIQNSDKLKKAGAVDILYINEDDAVREAATSNIFFFKKGVLYTTKDEILSGITRKAVIGLAKKRFKVIEKNFKLKELLSADEVFITATNKQVLPIVKIDGRKIGNGKVGEKTKVLMEDFKALVDRN